MKSPAKVLYSTSGDAQVGSVVVPALTAAFSVLTISGLSAKRDFAISSD